TSRSARGSAPPGKAVANLKGATELYLEGFPLKDRRRPIIAVFEVPGLKLASGEIIARSTSLPECRCRYG
ncbi:MAG: hypothetical protein WBH94_06845, partial [Methanoculleus sp.]